MAIVQAFLFSGRNVIFNRTFFLSESCSCATSLLSSHCRIQIRESSFFFSNFIVNGQLKTVKHFAIMIACILFCINYCLGLFVFFGVTFCLSRSQLIARLIWLRVKAMLTFYNTFIFTQYIHVVYIFKLCIFGIWI